MFLDEKKELSEEELKKIHGGSEIKNEITRKYNKKVSETIKNKLLKKNEEK